METNPFDADSTSNPFDVEPETVDANPFDAGGPPSGGDIDLTQQTPQAVVAPPLPSARLRRLRDRLKADPNTDPAQLDRIQRMLVQFTKSEAGEEPPPESALTQFGSAGAQAALLPIAGLSRVLGSRAGRVIPAVAVQQAVTNTLFGKDALRRFSDEIMGVIGVLEPVVDPGRPVASGLAQAGGAVVGSFATGIPSYKGGLAVTDAGWEAAKTLAPDLSKKALARVAQLAARTEAGLAPRLSVEAARRAGNLVSNIPREFIAGTVTTALTSPEEFSTWQGAALASALNLLGGLDSGVRPTTGRGAAGPVDYVPSSAGRPLTAAEQQVRQVAQKLRVGDPDAVNAAASVMAPRIPPGAVLVPIPGSDGSLIGNQALAQAIAQQTGATVAPILTRPRAVESSYARRTQGQAGLSVAEHVASMEAAGQIPPGAKVVLIDNVETTGSTAAAARQVLGRPDAELVAYARAPVPSGERAVGGAALAGDARAAAVSGGAGLVDADILRATPQEIAGFAKAAMKAEVSTMRSLFGPKGAKLYRKYQRMAVSDKSTPQQALQALEGIRRMEGKLTPTERQTLGELGKTGYTAKRLRRTAKVVAGYDNETLGKVATVDLVRQFGELLMTKKPEKNINTTYRLKKVADALALRGVAQSELITSSMRYMMESGVKSADAGKAVAEAVARVGVEANRLSGNPVDDVVPEPTVSKPSITSRVLMTPEARAAEARIKELEAKLMETEHERDIARREAETDPITGVGNARALERAAASADKDPGWKYVLFDVAGLGSFNNALGQGAGDALMQFVTRQMQIAGDNMGTAARVFRGAAKSDELYVLVKANTLDEARFYRELVEELVGVREARVGDASARAAITGEVGETLSDVKGKAVEDALTRRKALFKYANDLPVTKADETRALAQMITESEDIPQRITVRSLNPVPVEPVSSLRNPVESVLEGKMTDPGDAMEMVPRTEGLPEHSKHIQDRIETDPKVDDKRIGVVEGLNMLYTRLVRKHRPIELAEQEILGTSDVPAHQSAAAAAQLLSGTAGRVEQMLNFKPFRITAEGNIEFLPIKALSKILEPMKGRLNEYRRYLVARRTLELAERGIDVGVDVSAAQMEVANASPEIKQAAMETTQFNNATLQYWVDAGGLSQATAEALKLINRSYISFRRAFSREGQTNAAEKIRYAALSTPQQIREIVGSKLKILDPIFTTVDNTRRIMRAADLNRVGKQLVEMAELFPDRAVDLLERVKDAEADASPDLIADAGALMRAAKEAGITLHKEVAQELAATISDKALLVEGDIMRVWRNGKLEQWKVSKELGHALRSLGPQDINLIFRLLGLPSQFVKVGITSNPVFAAIQAFAGTFHAAIQSKYGFRPGIDSWIGFLNSVRNSQYRQEFLAAGGAFSQLGASEFRTTEAATRTVLPKTVLEKISTVAMHPIEALRQINAPLEEAARIGVYIRARKAGASALEAALEARRVDTDFSVIGSKMAAFAHMVAFLNPFIQGTDTAIRAIAKNPKKVMLVGMAGVTMPSIYFWMAGEGDQEVRDLQKSHTGSLNWVVRLPNGQIALLRKPYVYGQIFGNTAEEALNKLYEDDPNSYQRMAKALADQVTFNLEPNVFQMYRGMKTNRDPLTGNPIYPQGLEAAEPFLQSNYATSAFSQKVGEAINISPAMLDFSIRQLGGTILYDAVKATDAIIDTDGVSPPSPVPSDWPLMGRLLARYPTQSVEPVRSYYEDAEEVLKVMTTLRELEKQNRPEKFLEYAQENAVLLGLAPVYAQTREELSKMRLAMAQVRTLPDDVMDRDRKRETVDYLTRQIIEISRQINRATRVAKTQAQAQKATAAR